MPKHFRILSVLSIAFVATVLLPGCKDSDGGSAESGTRNLKGGAELWAQNCRRCHNARPAGALSADQWEAAVNHMRVRGGLTADESRTIIAFLKNAN